MVAGINDTVETLKVEISVGGQNLRSNMKMVIYLTIGITCLFLGLYLNQIEQIQDIFKEITTSMKAGAPKLSSLSFL